MANPGDILPASSVTPCICVASLSLFRLALVDQHQQSGSGLRDCVQSDDAMGVFVRSCGSVCNKQPYTATVPRRLRRHQSPWRAPIRPARALGRGRAATKTRWRRTRSPTRTTSTRSIEHVCVHACAYICVCVCCSIEEPSWLVGAVYYIQIRKKLASACLAL